jgi:hypothetical protein
MVGVVAWERGNVVRERERERKKERERTKKKGNRERMNSE